MINRSCSRNTPVRSECFTPRSFRELVHLLTSKNSSLPTKPMTNTRNGSQLSSKLPIRSQRPCDIDGERT